MNLRRLHPFAAALAPLLLVTPAGAATLVRQPFLQQVETQRALVVFRTDASCPARVHYGEGTSLDQVAADDSAAREHAIRLANLYAGKSYSYQVEACGERLGAVHSFRTATGRRSATVELAAIADEGTGGSPEVEVGNAILAERPEFWIGIGDNAYDSGTAAELQDHFFTPLAPLLAEIPVFPSTGNHEYVTDAAQPYLDAFYLPSNNPPGTERYYSFDWGPVHMVSVDSNCAAGWTPACDKDTLKSWLDADLAATDRPWKIVYFHHPLWSSGGHGSTLLLRQILGPVLDLRDVDLVLHGHDHDYERSKPITGESVAEGGVTYVVVGTVSPPPRPFPDAQPSWSAYRNGTYVGFLQVNIDGGTLTGQWKRPNGTVMDSFTLSKPVDPPPAPTLALTAEPGAGEAPLRALLAAQTDLLAPEIAWSFGDGTSATGAQVTHEFAQPGSYTVTATATSAAEGLTLTSQMIVNVGAANCGVTNTCPPDVSGNPVAPDPGGGCGGGGALALLVPFGILGACPLHRRPKRMRGEHAGNTKPDGPGVCGDSGGVRGDSTPATRQRWRPAIRRRRRGGRG